ncbi:MAG: hypothetical protein DI537_43715 [Stutzerimonas stutzeri]|nr:MAG: hypothetical protein DI537_43715 [Stutzerimonas stutzeri]
MTEATFWGNNHPLSPLAEAMGDKFIPMSGSTDYIEAECFRAILKLHHDYYNNGFGNEMSQPIAYLDRYFKGSIHWDAAFSSIREMAMNPWEKSDLDDDFVLTVAEVLLALQTADEAGKLTARDENDIWSMPLKPIDWPESSRFDYDDDEEEYA